MQTTWTFRRRYQVLIYIAHTADIYEYLGVMAFAGYESTSPYDDSTSASTLPYVLDDLGCNGSESNLLECLPQHNCGFSIRYDESAGVRCLRKGKYIPYVCIFACIGNDYNLYAHAVQVCH